MVSRRVRETPDGIAFCALDAHDAWQPITWKAYAARVSGIVVALRAVGLRRGQSVAILAPTSVDWECVQMACLALGIAVIGIDANYAIDQRDEILRSLEIDALFVEDGALAASIPGDVVDKIERLFVFRTNSEDPRVEAKSLDSLTGNVDAREGDELFAGAEPDDDALVVFSSGTTGRPKPIAYTHRQVLVAVESISTAYPDIAEGSHLLCWLPLANLFQRIVNFCGIERGATSYVIGDPKEVMRYLRRANPHLLIGVPRFYEKLHAGIRARLARSSRPVSAMADWALQAGARRARAARGSDAPTVFKRGTAKVADWLVLRRLRKIFGVNLRYLVSGSAPMPLWLLDWFDGIGLPVFEAYGVSESIVPIAINRPGEHRAATVGRPLPGQEVRLAEDNEILVRGPGVFRGYLSNAGDGASGPDALGFWPTGDYGEFDTDGFLRVIGRKSEVFKSATGRWIAPAGIEALLRRLPYVEHAMAFGAGRRFVGALISIEPAKSGREAIGRDVAEPAFVPRVSNPDPVIQRVLFTATAMLPGYQRPSGILITTRRFTIETGELTSNMKLRRLQVETEFAAQIQRLFETLEARGDGKPDSAPDPGSLVVQWV